MSEDITKTARDLLARLPKWETWEESDFYTPGIVMLPTTVKALIEEVELLRANLQHEPSATAQPTSKQTKEIIAEQDALLDLNTPEQEVQVQLRSLGLDHAALSEKGALVYQAVLVKEIEQLRAENKDLRWRIVANTGRLVFGNQPRWLHVKNTTGFGRTSAIKLCRDAGFDPYDVIYRDEDDNV